MDDEEKTKLDAAIKDIEQQVTVLATVLSKANSQVKDLQDQMAQLKSLRVGKPHKQANKASWSSFQELADFIGSLPYAVRDRVHEFAEERQETGDELLAVLRQEARALELYDAIYSEVDAVHDLANPMLSRAIRSCIDHAGLVPDGSDRDTLLRECPQILEAIKSAYQKHV